MEGTPLRSLPARPPASIEPAEALAYVGERLPELDAVAREALSLVALVGHSRAEVADSLGLEATTLADALTRARKVLRRTLEQLPAGGWCERAERLISDRFDGELTPRGAARLEAHLRSCERCATHELRLMQAHDELVHALASPLQVAAPPPELRVVEPEVPDSGRPLAWYVLVGLLALLLVAAAVAGVLIIAGG
jgi:hypothetical protein